MTATLSVDPGLVERVHSLIRAYVMRKAESKSGIKWDDIKTKRVPDPSTGKEKLDIPPRYREVREKVCTEAFLRLRACRSREDFIAYFTGTICSVPQYLPEVEYQALATALLSEEGWEDVKALAMLALAGLSRV